MADTHRLFSELQISEKIDFFVNCQQLLAAHHPGSPFLCHAANVEQRLQHIDTLFNRYQGYVYQDANVCALYNKLQVVDPQQPELAVRAAMYKAPAENYNSIIVDFVVFRDIKDCTQLLAAGYDAKVAYILFVRHNKIKLYKALDFMQQILQLRVE